MKRNLLYTALAIIMIAPFSTFATETGSSSPALVSTSTVESFISGSSTVATSTPQKSFTVCSQEAIEARDTAIASSRLVYNTTMAKALNDRKNREKAAVAIVRDDAKKTAIKNSVETYKTQAKNAQAILTDSRDLAWYTFANDIKICRDIEDANILLMEQESGTTSLKMAGPNDTTSKTFGDVLRSSFENFKSLFNN